MKKCWANSDGKCSSKLSREHLISKSIINNKKFWVHGFSWCKNEPKEISEPSFVNKFLCEYHNSSLSKFDSEIANFVSAIEMLWKNDKKFSMHGFSKKKIPIRYIINGFNLERWFVKTLINVSLTGVKKIKIHFDKILPVLYENIKFEKPYGLSLGVKTGQIYKAEDKIQITPILNEREDFDELAGGIFMFLNFRIIVLIPCSIDPIENNVLKLSGYSSEFDGVQINWHNENINHEIKVGKKRFNTQSIIFSWDNCI